MLIPVVNNEFYPRWFLLDLLCLHSSVLCKNPVTSLYLAGVSPNFLIVFCIKSLMLDLTKYIQILHNLSCVHLSVNSSDALPTCPRDPFHADKGIQRVCGTRPGSLLLRESLHAAVLHLPSPQFPEHSTVPAQAGKVDKFHLLRPKS